jgi:hypothetical protein
MAEAAVAIGLNLNTLTDRQRRRFGVYVLSELEIPTKQISVSLDLDCRTVRLWGQRQQDGLKFRERPRPGCGRTYLKDVEDRFIAFYCQTTPLEGCGRWTLRTAEMKLAKAPGLVGTSLSRSTMQRILSRHLLKPHLSRYLLHISDPAFFLKMERIVGVYLNPPKHLFCFDECPGIQVLARISPDIRPGDEAQTTRWLNEFEYIRNGTLDLFAFLEVKTSNVTVEVRADHKKETFISVFRNQFLSLSQDVRDDGVDYIMDNLDSHCSYKFCELVAELSGTDCPSSQVLSTRDKRREWLQRKDKRIVIHFTPFHGSWLNMVEIWFRMMGSKCLKDSYSSPDRLRKAIIDFARLWSNEWARPFRWQYDGKGLHQKAVLRFVALLNRSANEMLPQFIKKQALLMINLINYYEHEVEKETWWKLIHAVKKTVPVMQETIVKSTQPIVKQQAGAALEALLRNTDTLEDRLAA